MTSGNDAGDKHLNDEVEAAVQHAAKTETHHMESNDMPVPPESVEFDKATEL